MYFVTIVKLIFILFLYSFLTSQPVLSAPKTDSENNKSKLVCTDLFSKQVTQTIPVRLLLDNNWSLTHEEMQINYQVMDNLLQKEYTKIYSLTAEDYVTNKKIKFYHRQEDSYTRKARSVSYPKIVNYNLLRNNDVLKVKQELKDILQYRDDFKIHSHEILDSYGDQIVERIILDISREIVERTLRFLIANGVSIRILNSDEMHLSAVILTEGQHKLNKRAAQIKKDFKGLQLRYIYDPHTLGALDTDDGFVHLSEYVLLDLDPKSEVLGHELKHAQNYINNKRDFGVAISLEHSFIPGAGYTYDRMQHYEEAEALSYSLKRQASEILQLMINGQLDTKRLDIKLYKLAEQGSVITRRNKIITDLLKKEFEKNNPLLIEQRKSSWLRNDYRALFELEYEGRKFIYKMPLPNYNKQQANLTHFYVSSKIDEMSLLNPNYEAQFQTVLQASGILISTESKVERMAILAGIISITRPHFWDEQNFLVVTESDLADRFNTVISDRLKRYENF